MGIGDPRIGITDLDGAAVRLFRALKDDNHSAPADEDEALENFRSISTSFFDTQKKFIAWCEKQAGSAD
jgi:hypothetical protein